MTPAPRRGLRGTVPERRRTGRRQASPSGGTIPPPGPPFVIRAGGRIDDVQDGLVIPPLPIPWRVLSAVGTIIHLQAVIRLPPQGAPVFMSVRLLPPDTSAIDSWGDGIGSTVAAMSVLVQAMLSIQPGPDDATRTFTGRQTVIPSGVIPTVMDPSERQFTARDDGMTAIGLYVGQAEQVRWSEVACYPGPGS